MPCCWPGELVYIPGIGDLRWGPCQLCLFSVSIALQSAGRCLGDSEHAPFRLGVEISGGICGILVVVRIRQDLKDRSGRGGRTGSWFFLLVGIRHGCFSESSGA